MTNEAAVTYSVTVQGQLDDHWMDWLEGARIVHNADGTSTIELSVADQAQLHGVLSRLRDIGAPLVSLETVR